MKILLLGKNGMLGRAIEKEFTPHGGIIAWGRKELDITNKHAVFAKIKKLHADIVINATGYTNVDGAETELKQAFAVNAEGVSYIAEACAQIGATLFNFSTDYIFDGLQPLGYTEDDVEHIGPLNVYGESKLEGEQLIQNGNSKCKSFKYFIIRTSWLYGAGGKNFVDTLILRAKDGQKEFKVVNDQFGKPTYTKDLAERVVWMVENIDRIKSGVYHCTNEVRREDFKSTTDLKSFYPAGITWYTFACEIFKQAHHLGIIKTIPTVTPCTTAEFPRPAKRPSYSALINTKLPRLREWREALQEYIKTYITTQFT